MKTPHKPTESPATVTESQLLELSEALVSIAMGDFEARLERSGDRSVFDVMSYLVNNMAEEVGDLFAERERQRHRLAAILDAMIDGLVLLDGNGTIQHINGAFGKLLGVEPERLVGRDLSELLMTAEARERLTADIADGAVVNLTVMFRAQDGGPLPLAVNGSPLFGAGDHLAGFVVVARDQRPFNEAKEKMLLYEKLRQKQAELVHSAKLAALGELAGAVAHEINNPLQAMSALSEFLSEDLQTIDVNDPNAVPCWLENLRGIQSAIEKCSNITRQLLELARESPTVYARIDLREVARDTIQLVGHKMTTQKVTLNVCLPEPLPVHGNAGQLGQVLLNLIINAGHSVGSQGTIVVDGRCASGEVLLRVSDDGEGIAPEHIDRLFDPFFTTKGQGAGTGLGLSVSYGIVEAHGGRLRVDSAGPGQGACFSLLLPSSHE